ncbi:hypothetical protein BDV98DRAFT_309980 [Pterulicium gracile]|uniref:C2H2-type domain-containing protein n=1 Tax=Pterulicium gracile TaxID=1884261 RepID=A0A5C3Q5H1_9AGAR|nr:hypothetical protein BDV98DRAFT_309980 [Pterula gracilis]
MADRTQPNSPLFTVVMSPQQLSPPQPQHAQPQSQQQVQPAQSASTTPNEDFPQHYASPNPGAPATPAMIDGLFSAGFFNQSFDSSAMPFGSLLSCLDSNMQDPTSPEVQKDAFLPGANDQQQQFNWGDDAFLQSLDMNVDGQQTPQTELPESLFSEEWMLTPPTSVASLSSSASTSSSRYSSPASDIVELPASGAASPDGKPASPSKRHDRYDRRRFPCPIPDCNRRFTSQYTLKVHVKAHRPKPRPCFPCTLGCNEQFSRQHDRLRHEVAKHRKVCEWSCAECGRFFSSSKTLGNHKCKVATGKSSMRWMSQPSTPTPAPLAALSA